MAEGGRGQERLLDAIDALIAAVNHPYGIDAAALQQAIDYADEARTLLEDGGCTCGNGEAEEDRGAVLRCPVHGLKDGEA